MAYTTIDNPTDYFRTKLYSGQNTSQSITFDESDNMSPDWVWIKSRNGSGRNHCLYDSVRGVNKRLESDNANAENSASDQLTSFDTNGFTVGIGEADINSGGRTFVSWNWLAGGTASSNTDGSITSSVSANTIAGFSIVKYTGTGSNATIGHGLGVVPKMIIFKVLDSATNWVVYHVGVGNTGALRLDNSNATQTNSVFFQDTTPSSSIITIGTGSDLNTSGQSHIAYCFAEKPGYSKFGSYTGNGNSDGTFVYTGFRPAWVLYKNTTTADSWFIHDNKRQGFNDDNEYLFADLSQAEGTINRLRILSNGFKAIDSDKGVNKSGDTYIYMAFAESPFVNSNGVPTNAR